MLRGLRPGMLLLVFVLLAPSVAWAAGKATARTLALEAQQAFDAGDYARAAELLERADQHFHAPPHLVMEARARIELKQLVEARELLLSVINEPESTNPAFKSARGEALTLLAAVDKRVAHLSLQVMPEVPPGLELIVDGKPWAVDLLEVATPVNPGEYTVVARAPGFRETTGSIKLEEGQADQLVIELERAEGKSEAAKPADTGSAEPESARRGPGVLSYVLWGTGVVGVGVGVTLLVTGADKSSQAGALLESDCTPLSGGGWGCSPQTNDEITALDQDAATQQTIGVIALSVGVAALAGGTILALVRSPSRETAARDTRVSWLATPLPGGGFVGLKGAF